MKLDVDLIRQQLAREPVRSRIAADYGIDEPSHDPVAFAAQVIAQFDQPPADDALATTRSNSDVFRAAVMSIASSNARWSAFLKEKDNLTELLAGFDPVVTASRLASDEIVVDDIARHLKSPYRAADARRIGAWAALLATSPSYYDRIRDVGAAVRTLADPARLGDEKLMLCLVGYFTQPTTRWSGEGHLGGELRAVPAADRKFIGMGRPLASEFLRNLGWNGYKPDRHILRLFHDWSGEPTPEHIADEARQLAAHIGRRDKQLLADLESALVRIELTPPDISYLEADNLVWLLGAYVETLRPAAPHLRYIIP